MMDVSSIGSVSVNQVMEQAGTKPDSLGGLADKFNRMMEVQPPTAAPHDTGVGASSPISHFIGSQEALMRQTFDDVRSFSAEAPSMNPTDLAARHIELTYQLSMVQVQFNAGVYISQSSKSGLQTLMKNQ
jgi:type III secretion inner rod protein HrpB2